MLLPHLPMLNARRIVLASQSPRRQELLSGLGVKFEVVVSGFAEDLDKSVYSTAAAYCTETARQKALEVARSSAADLVIGADTVVELEGRVMEKPSDAAAAQEMLSSLSGRAHSVHTGVAIVLPNSGRGGAAAEAHTFCESTRVHFTELTPEVIEAYIATREPFDKAGGYGIQGYAGSFVEKLEGDYFAVMGLPVHGLSVALSRLIANGDV
mmetsp:Transcript_1189/g.4448  ORF Transcript_1189/g.4448 Transcript_1189/m.4448 type:complete len:211 (+) Transcript_1189:31-663(+)